MDHQFLHTLALVLGAAALATILFQKLKQPVILGYLIAGMIVGPHIPIPLQADSHIVHTLSETGVILLMFSLGLEFSLRKLFKVFPAAGFIAIFECSLMIWIGYLAGHFFGWTKLESIFTGALVAISSTSVLIKAFSERNIQGKLNEIVFGILIVEDLVAILLLALLTPLSQGMNLSAEKLGGTLLSLFCFLLILLILGILLIPNLFRFIIRLERPEITLVASVAFCFGLAWLAQAFGYSVALGAFLAGSLIAESGEEKQIEILIQPVRDMFGAIFFVSVGMLINPSIIPQYWPQILILTSLVVIGKLIGVSLGSFFTGYSPKLSIKAGMSLGQIGEFSFIIASVGLSSGATRDFLYPIAVTVSTLTTLLTPWLLKAAIPLSNFVDKNLPPSLQTFTSLYGSWVQKLRQTPLQSKNPVKRLLKFIAIDFILLVILVIGIFIFRDKIFQMVSSWISISDSFLDVFLFLFTGVCTVPFCVGLIQCTKKLGWILATQVIPDIEKGKLDLAAAPRRSFVVALQLLILLILGISLLALTQPFLPPLYSSLIFGIILIFFIFSFWKGTENLQGHVRSGAQVVLEALTPSAHPNAAAPPELESFLPGLGDIQTIILDEKSPSIGKTLAEIDLRGLTGATVMAITRKNLPGIVIPTAHERLQAGDTLALIGSLEIIDSVKQIL